MHTILGANGIIGEELAKELKSNWTSKIKLVGRNPQEVNEGDILHKADLRDLDEVKRALKGIKIAYLTVGLPYDSKIWSTDWTLIMGNVINGCIENNAKLVYFDNTYAYLQDSKIQTEETELNSTGIKGIAKMKAAQMMLKAMEENKIEGVICRAPEFYGLGKTKGITNGLLFMSLKHGKKPKVLLKDDVLRTLIYTPDASKAMALIANSPDAYGQTWHLPCDDNRLTYREFVDVIAQKLGREIKYTILSKIMISTAALVNANMKETQELLPRYAIDNIFDSSKFKRRFPDFKVTTYQEGIYEIIEDYGIK